MKDKTTQAIRESYDRVADEYARRVFNELHNKPQDQELRNRFRLKRLGEAKYAIWDVAIERLVEAAGW